MRQRQYVAYYRVSTPQQAHSGLGLEAQRESVERYVQKVSGKLVAEFTEVKSGRKTKRPQLAEAMRTCRMRRAVLVIARLDRLARNVALIAELMDDELEFVAVDFPTASRLTLHVLAAIAEYESRLISERTKAAFAAALARGEKLGRPGGAFIDPRAAIAASVKSRKERALAQALDVAPVVWELLAKGKSQNEIAAELNQEGFRTPRKCAWDGEGVGRVMRLTEKALPALAAAAAARPDWRAVRARARAEALAPVLWGLRGGGLSLEKIAEEMNRRAIPTPGGSRWTFSSVSEILLATKGMVPEADAISAAADCRAAPARRRALALAPLVIELRKKGKALRAIAEELTRRGIPTMHGRPWSQASVRRLLVIAAKAEAKQTGVAPGTPFRTPPLDPRAQVMDVARRIWELKALGKSTAAIVSELNRLKIKPVKRGRWHQATVERVMRLTAERFPQQVMAAEAAPSPRMLLARERASKLAPLVRRLRARMSFNEVAAELTRRGIPTPFGGRRWWATTVWKVVKRADEAAASAAVPRRARKVRPSRPTPARRAATKKKAA